MELFLIQGGATSWLIMAANTFHHDHYQSAQINQLRSLKSVPCVHDALYPRVCDRRLLNVSAHVTTLFSWISEKKQNEMIDNERRYAPIPSSLVCTCDVF